MIQPAEDPVAWLEAFPRFGAGPGLHRVSALEDALLGPWPEAREWLAGLAAIKITGSNGKGSTAAMTAAILGRLGVSCGLYTSPHLYRFHERIAVGGEPVSDGELARAVERLAPAVEGYRRGHPKDAIGAFEVTTVAALACFAERRPETVVAEAGIGGRFDPTRIFPGPVAGLTSLDLEHTDLLGETREQIAYDKADLCPDGGSLAVGEIGAEVRRRVEGYAAVRGIRLAAVGREARIAGLEMTPRATWIDLEVAASEDLPAVSLPRLEVGMVGPHQASNAALAVLLVRRWLAQSRPDLLAAGWEGAVRAGLSSVAWPGRFEHRSAGGVDVFLDVGHTPAATDVLARTLEAALAGRPLLLVAGVSEGRDPQTLLAPLAPRVEAAVATRAQRRGMPAAEVATTLERLAPGLAPVAVEPAAEALRLALERARREGLTVLVAGSLFLVAELGRLLSAPPDSPTPPS